MKFITEKILYDNFGGSVHKNGKCVSSWFRSTADPHKWWVIAGENMEMYVMDDFGNLTWIEG